MRINNEQSSSHRLAVVRGFTSLGLGFALLTVLPQTQAQEVVAATAMEQPAAEAGSALTGSSSSVPDSLPDAPAVMPAEASGGMQQGVANLHPQPAMAGPYTKYIQPGQSAPRLTVGDKIILGLRDSVSPLAAVGWLAAAGYEQGVNGSPNYGQTGKGFAQRLGAAAARDTSEGIFSDSVLAPLLHEDPRYYKLGRGHNFIVRLAYAGTRPLITRTDGGRQTPNFSLLGGNLAGSALTQAYYPPLNRGFSQVLQTFGSSIGGSAIGDVVSEFLSDTLQALHISKAR